MWMHTTSCWCLIILDTETIKRRPRQVGVLNGEDVSALFLSPLETFVFRASLQHKALSTYNRILQLKGNAISNVTTHSALCEREDSCGTLRGVNTSWNWRRVIFSNKPRQGGPTSFSLGLRIVFRWIQYPEVVILGLVVSVLAIGPKVRGFWPGPGIWIFKGDKNPQPSFGGEVKPSAQCRKVLRHLKKPIKVWKKYFVRQNLSFISPVAPALLFENSRRIAREIWWADQEFLPVCITLPWFSMLIYHLGEEE
jgi:hypothetical protein